MDKFFLMDFLIPRRGIFIWRSIWWEWELLFVLDSIEGELCLWRGIVDLGEM